MAGSGSFVTLRETAERAGGDLTDLIYQISPLKPMHDSDRCLGISDLSYHIRGQFLSHTYTSYTTMYTMYMVCIWIYTVYEMYMQCIMG